MNANTPDIIGSALVDAFAQRGYAASLPDPETVSVTLRDGTRVQAGIREWREHARRSAPEHLPGIAARYADQAVRAFERNSAPAPAMTDDLRVRLYPEEALDERMRAALVTRTLAPGLVQAVVADHPDTMMPLNRADLGGANENAVFGKALAHSIEDEPHYIQTHDVEGVRVAHIGERHRYIGAHVHVLGRYFPGPLPYGALLAFPVPEYVLFHGIGTDKHLVTVLATLQDLAAKHVSVGERPITAQIYWWRPGAYEHMDEREALASGLVPDLRPVGVQIDTDGEGVEVGMLTEDTGDLIQLWLAEQ
ncbi:hypothetical protein [Actinomadura fibrosa]|uniref:Uncharacterized protein n=1 Tax=Actinomadura fibrosa TaxID=111802 RepID=A0ABW2XSX5_9ACTN|nr:hypothetical protein [Actinomadura fibrosa]